MEARVGHYPCVGIVVTMLFDLRLELQYPDEEPPMWALVVMGECRVCRLRGSAFCACFNKALPAQGEAIPLVRARTGARPYAAL
ncbi:MAG: hypothetical protein N2651_07955 [Fimbriimonadales bacterium]|nr:hypothetical protein [Fimbriimonadales bacterium]